MTGMTMRLAAAPVFAPTLPLQQVTGQVLAGAQQGAQDANSWTAIHQKRDDTAFSKYAHDMLGQAPDKDASAAELPFMHAVQDARTGADTAVAKQLDKHPGDVWNDALAAWSKTVSADQAKRGADLLRQAMELNGQITMDTKDAEPRLRPYALDPTLKRLNFDMVDPHHSFPSGHASSAFAAAAILGSLMPDRAEEFEQDAAQVAYARVYSGVHFPSDVEAGARLGTMVANYILQTAAA